MGLHDSLTMIGTFGGLIVNHGWNERGKQLLTDGGEEKAEDEREEDKDEEESGHDHTAEEVYEDENATGVLHLNVGGLYLDLLGFEINLDPVILDISARQETGIC